MELPKLSITVALVLASTLGIDGLARELHARLCPYGCPAGAPRTNDVVVREIYVLSSNDTTKFRRLGGLPGDGGLHRTDGTAPLEEGPSISGGGDPRAG